MIVVFLHKFFTRGFFLLFVTISSLPCLQATSQERLSEKEEADSLARARQILAKGQWEEGVDLLRSLVKQTPNQLEARVLLGSTLALLSHRSEAMQELEQVIRLRPDYAPGYQALGQVLARFGDIELAKGAFERAVKYDPSSSEARLNLALMLAQLHEFEQAGEQLDQVIEQMGETEAAAYPHYLRGRVFNELNQSAKAAGQYRAAVALRPQYVQAYLDLGLTQRRLGGVEAAVEAFEKAAALAPARWDTNYYLGREYLAQQKAEQAVGYLQKALSKRPDDTSILFSLAQAFRLQGNEEGARELEERLAALRRESQKLRSQSLQVSNLNDEALQLEKQGSLEEASEKLREALRIDPSQGSVRRNLGLLLCRMGKWKEGIRELRRAHNENPEDPKTRKALSLALDRAAEAGIDLTEDGRKDF